MRCPQCNLFHSTEPGDPEVNLELGDFNVNGDIHIVLNCQDCGEEMKETTVDVDFEPEGLADQHHDHMLDCRLKSENPTIHFETTGETVNETQTETLSGRKPAIEVNIDYTITCECKEFTFSGSHSDTVATSEFDEL